MVKLASRSVRNAEFGVQVPVVPLGAMTRYVRDIYALSDKSIPFGQYLKEYWEKNDADVEVRNSEHPIEYNKTFDIGPQHTVTIFKRQGEDWLCSECNMAPNGGSGER